MLGSEGNDTLRGGTNDDILLGGLGDDHIVGDRAGLIAGASTSSGLAGYWWSDKEKHFADVNGDARADMIGLTGDDSSLLAVWLGQIDGSFVYGDAHVHDLALNWWAERRKLVGDVDGDGRLDIVAFTGDASWGIAVLGWPRDWSI